MKKRFNCPTGIVTVNRKTEKNVLSAINLCCAENVIECDGIPSRHPTADESAAALRAMEAQGLTFDDEDDDDDDDEDKALRQFIKALRARQIKPRPRK